MNPEIWMIIEDEKVGELVTDVAESEGLVLRSFENIAGMFNQPDPAGGLILVIDASGELKNYMTIIKRFAKRNTALDTIVFGEEKMNIVFSRQGGAQIISVYLGAGVVFRQKVVNDLKYLHTANPSFESDPAQSTVYRDLESASS